MYFKKEFIHQHPSLNDFELEKVININLNLLAS